MRGFKSLAVLLAALSALVLYVGSARAIILSTRGQTEIYIHETEGKIHNFTALLYKAVNGENQQSKAETINISKELEAIYPDGINGAVTSFKDKDKAIQYVQWNVYNNSAILQLLNQVVSYAIAHKVSVLHVALTYRCTVNGKDKQVVLYFNYPVNNALQNNKVGYRLPQQTTGFLVADLSPTWVRVIYISNRLDPSIASTATAKQLRQELISKGILGKLEIDEMNLDGSLVKHLLVKTITDSRYEFPTSGSYVPDDYITKVINDYKDVIESDSPLFILFDYIESPFVATTEDGKHLKISMSVVKKEVDFKFDNHAESWGGLWGPYGKCMTYLKEGTGESAGEYEPEAKNVGWWEGMIGMKQEGGKLSVCKSEMSSTDNGYGHYSTNYGNRCGVKFSIAKGGSSTVYFDGRPITLQMQALMIRLCSGANCTPWQTIFTDYSSFLVVDRKMDEWRSYGLICTGYGPENSDCNWMPYCAGFEKSMIAKLQIHYAQVRLCAYEAAGRWCQEYAYDETDQNGNSTSINNGIDQGVTEKHCSTTGSYFSNMRLLGCGNWIDLMPKPVAYRTRYNVTYDMSGILDRYLIPEPLKKLSNGDYSMTLVLTAKLNFKNSVLGGLNSYEVEKIIGDDVCSHKAYPYGIVPLYGSTVSGLSEQTKEAFDKTLPNACKQWNTIKWAINGRNKGYIDNYMYYYIVDPFNTSQIIDVRNDTVNGLPITYYHNYSMPTTFRFVDEDSDQ